MLRRYSSGAPKILINIHVQDLRNNFIRKDVNRFFYPMHFVLTMILSAKYTLKDNFITSKGIKYYITTYLILLLVIIIYTYQFFCDVYYDENHLNQSVDRISTTVFFYIYYIVCFNSIFILNIMKRNSNVLLILTIEKIHDIIFNNRSIERFIVWNWFLSIFLLIYDLFCYITVLVLNPYYDIRDLVFDYMFTTLNLNFVYAIRIIILLTEYVKEWKNNIVTMNEDEDNEEYCIRMFDVFQNVLEAFKIFKELFQLVVSILTNIK